MVTVLLRSFLSTHMMAPHTKVQKHSCVIVTLLYYTTVSAFFLDGQNQITWLKPMAPFA
eukprot:c21557_g4_i1 orf=297-473(-)